MDVVFRQCDRGGRALAFAAENGQKSDPRLARLLSFVDADPDNLQLLADTASAAFDAGAIDVTAEMLERYRTRAELPPPLLNLDGLTALRASRRSDAAAAFDALIAQGFDDGAVRFNRAWVHALEGEHEAALALLDDDAVAAAPRAAPLKVQMLHHLGRLEEALAIGQGLIERDPGNDILLGAMSVVAMDADDAGLAYYYANQAQGGADAFTTRGLMALNEDRLTDAIDAFDRALAEQPEAPRAWLGKGLGLVASGDLRGGSVALSRGAETFGDHVGSWIAVAWTQFTTGELTAARQTFEKALALDENFAESHGGLAAIDAAEGKLESSERRARIAFRLDRHCFGAMLARLLIEQARGNPDAAQRIWDGAMTMPTGVDGKTLAQAMVGFGLDPGKRTGGGA